MRRSELQWVGSIPWIVTITGERTQKAYRAMTEAEGFSFSSPEEAMEKAYEDGEYDYFIQPSVSKTILEWNKTTSLFSIILEPTEKDR